MDKGFLESFILDKMSETGLPGLSIAIIKDEQLVYARGFGQRDIENGYPSTPDTLYSVASVTKSFTALAILQLAEQAKLSLDDDISDYLDFNIKPKGQNILIKHLLSHSSGIPSLAYAEALINKITNGSGKTLAISGPKDIMTFASESADWVETAPGERWFYFNEGYAMLGQIIEDVSGLDYNDYIQQNILEPLNMNRTVFSKKDLDSLDDVAVPYIVRPNQKPLAGEYIFRSIRSEGGLISSVTDLARYISMYLNAGKGIISAASLKEMQKPRVVMPWNSNPELFSSNKKAQPVASYGYGLIIDDFYGEALIGHSGHVGVATSQISFLPKLNLGVAVLANGSGYATSQFAKIALANYLDKDISKLAFFASENALVDLTGRYQAYKGTVQARVIKHADFLKLFIEPEDEEIILVPKTLGSDRSSFFTLANATTLTIDFYHRDGNIELIFERYKFKKTGTL